MTANEFIESFISPSMRYFRGDRQPVRIQAAPTGDLWVMAGPALERRLEAEVLLRTLNPRVLLLVGLPGCGKTYVLSKIMHKLKKAGKIRKCIEIFGSPSKTAAVLLDDELVLDPDSKVFVNYRQSQIRKAVHPDFMLPCDEYTREEAMLHFARHPEQYVWVFVDEATRFREIFFNEAMVPLSDCKYVINDRAYYLPVRWALSCNPSGMSGSCAVFDSAVLARINKRFNVFQADVDTLTDIMVYPIALETAKLNEVSIQYEQVRVAAAISILTWGFPLERRALAYVSDRSKRLMEGIAEASPEVAQIMNEIGRCTDFGTDGRKPIHWCESAIAAAQLEGVSQLQPHHFLQTVASCIAHGGKDNFTEGASPEVMKRKAELITRLAEICFADAKIRSLILNTKSSGQITQKCGLVLFTSSQVHGRFRSALDEMFTRLEDAGFEVDLRKQVWSKFFDFIHPQLSELELSRWLSDVGVVDSQGCLYASAEQEFLVQLGAVEELTPIGKLVATLVRDEDGRMRPVGLQQQLREAALRFPILSDFHEVLIELFTEDRELAAHAKTICECVAVALDDSLPWQLAIEHQMDVTATDDTFITQLVLKMLHDRGMLGGSGPLEGIPTRKFLQELFIQLHEQCDSDRIRHRLKTISEQSAEFKG